MILVATLEHWLRVADGAALDWRTPGWFWPATNTIGLTDTYALFAVPYITARWLGVGLFKAFDVAVGTFAVIGYWTFMLLMRRLGVRWSVAAAFGFVFAFGSLVTMKLGHAQTYTIMLAPVLAYLLLAAWQSSQWNSAALAGLAGLWFGAMTLTAPQTGWFLVLDGALTGIVLSICTPSRQWWAALARLRPMLAGLLIGGSIGMVPAVTVYRATIGEHTREWLEVAAFLPRFPDIMNVQPGNMLWHHLLYRMGISQTANRPIAEVALGFTPAVLLAALLGIVGLLRQRMLRSGPEYGCLALACLLTPFLSWLLTVDIAGHSAWWLVWNAVPGGLGIRTPFRIQLASLFLLCVGLAYATSKRLDQLTGRLWPSVLLTLLVCVCVAEQANSSISAHDNRAAEQWLTASRHPPSECKVFYLLPTPHDISIPWTTQQSDAMLLSQIIGLPTINGNSSWVPPGWMMYVPSAPDYPDQIRAWLAIHPVDHLCGVSPRQGLWRGETQPIDN